MRHFGTSELANWQTGKLANGVQSFICRLLESSP